MSEAKFYNNIVDLPLNKFIEAKTSNPQNLHVLVISGDPTPEQLRNAWMDIEQEYSDALGDMDHKMYLQLLKEVTNLAVDYQKMQQILPFLLTIPFAALQQVPGAMEETLQTLEVIYKDINKVLKTSFAFDHTNPEQYEKEVKRCLNMSASLKLRFDIKQSEFDAVKPKHEEGAAVTKEYFYSVLNTLEDHAKVPLSDTMTVYRFCDRMRKYNDYCKRQAEAARKTK